MHHPPHHLWRIVSENVFRGQIYNLQRLAFHYLYNEHVASQLHRIKNECLSQILGAHPPTGYPYIHSTL